MHPSVVDISGGHGTRNRVINAAKFYTDHGTARDRIPCTYDLICSHGY